MSNSPHYGGSLKLSKRNDGKPATNSQLQAIADHAQALGFDPPSRAVEAVLGTFPDELEHNDAQLVLRMLKVWIKEGLP